MQPMHRHVPWRHGRFDLPFHATKEGRLSFQENPVAFAGIIYSLRSGWDQLNAAFLPRHGRVVSTPELASPDHWIRDGDRHSCHAGQRVQYVRLERFHHGENHGEMEAIPSLGRLCCLPRLIGINPAILAALSFGNFECVDCIGNSRPGLFRIINHDMET